MGGFGRPILPSRSTLADHKNGDQTEKSHDEKYRPESRIGKNISSHNLNLLTINQLNPKRNIVVPKLDSTTPISFLSTKSEANKKAKETTPAFIQMSENNRYSDLENRIISSEYHENKNIVNQVFAADGTDFSTPGVSSGFDVYYPFRSLFTGRQQNELEFEVNELGDYFSFKSKIPKELIGYKLAIPSIYDKEVTQLDNNDLTKKEIKTPQIFLDGEFVPFASPSGDIIDLPYIKEGNLEVRVPKIDGYYSSNIQPTTYNLQPKSCDQFNKGIYTHDRVTEGNNELLRLTSIGSSNCLDFDIPNLSQDIGYLVTVENRNIEGKSLLFSVINKNSQRADIETYLPAKALATAGLPAATTSYFIIPPMEQYGLGYTLHLDNISIGRVKTVNDLGRITVNPIPYRFLTGLKVIKSADQLPITNYQLPMSVHHPNPSLYEITINNEQITDNNSTLVLSQSFDSGWKAYSINSKHLTFNKSLIQLFPFLFGQEIKEHVLVNNWENGWGINNDTMNQCYNGQCNIIIVYLPQYLEYIGFILLGIAVLVVIFYPKSSFSHKLSTIN